MRSHTVTTLLNMAHAIDHMFLLIFASSVGAIAVDFGLARWEDLMPYGAGAFLLFGLGSLPAGRLGDLWGRRAMMLVFFFGMGISALLAAATQNPWQLAAALTLLGLFASIYHPVGIPMLVQTSTTPGATIGVNGLVGNLGIAVAAVMTGFLVQQMGWRAAFIVPGLLAIVAGLLFARWCPPEVEAPARRKSAGGVVRPRALVARVLVIMTVAAASSSMLFNLSTNANTQLLDDRLRAWVADPAAIGMLLGVLYAIASVTQLVVGHLIDRVAVRPLYLAVALAQVPVMLLASQAQGWWLYGLLLVGMALIFGAVPFTDALIVRYVEDRMRSRVAGARFAVSLGLSSTAVWVLGPLVKQGGFTAMFFVMAAAALVTASVVWLLPREPRPTPPSV